jgi:hypothetical protein
MVHLLNWAYLILHLNVSDGEAMSVPSITLTTCFQWQI